MKAFARQDGAFMGLLWIVSFACFVVSQEYPALSLFFDLTLISIPFFASLRIKNYRDKVINGVISFRRAFAYSLLIFLYATLLLAIAQWIYFQYIDNGSMVGGMIKTVNSPEFGPVLEAYKITKEEMNKQLDLLTSTRPIDLVCSFMWLNMTAGIIISWVVALFTKKSKRQR